MRKQSGCLRGRPAWFPAAQDSGVKSRQQAVTGFVPASQPRSGGEPMRMAQGLKVAGRIPTEGRRAVCVANIVDGTDHECAFHLIYIITCPPDVRYRTKCRRAL